MTPQEARKLLGGYATGTLTEAERRALFAAALGDQSLFDALAEEEGLRALLADPGSRARLLAALGGPAVPRWRRPATLSLAASLLVAIGVGVLMRRVPARIPAAPAVLPEESPSSPPARFQAPANGSAVPPARKARRAPSLAGTPAPSPAPPPVPPPSAGAAAAPPPPAQPGASTDALRAKAETTRSAKPEASRADLAASSQGMALSPERFDPSAPIWTWEPAPAGRFSLAVRWGPAGHLYLLRRGGAAASVLAPVSAEARSGERTLSRFKGALGPEQVLDLYLLPEPAPHPEALPAEGPVPGFRARIQPKAAEQP